jgi:hypothetical protein
LDDEAVPVDNPKQVDDEKAIIESNENIASWWRWVFARHVCFEVY